MTIGWVTFTTPKYLPLVEVLCQSISRFSKHPIEVFCSDCSLENKAKNIIERRLDIGTENFADVCYAKNLRCAIETSFTNCVVIDADMVANANCDDLLDLAKICNQDHTINAGHGCDPDNQAPTMEKIGVYKKTMPYVYSTYISNDNAKPFLEICWNYATQWQKENFVPPQTGETILNCMLWKWMVREQLNCFLPYIDVLPHYFSNGKEPNPLEGYYAGKNLSYHFFHGEKDANKARKILEKLDRNRVDNFLAINPQIGAMQ